MIEASEFYAKHLKNRGTGTEVDNVHIRSVTFGD